MNTDPVDPYLVGLNAPQREAVLHDGGPLVVFAGAGSGKTRVITHRVARLVTDLDVAPFRILAVTFTNKAAQEMRERLDGILGRGPTRDLWVGTFHATCARLLRRYAEPIGIRRDFTIYDQADSLALVKRVLRDLQAKDERLTPKAVAARIQKEKQEVRGPGDMEVRFEWESVLREAYDLYETRLRTANALDFGDLLYRFVAALESDAQLRGELQRRFSHLLVDEFQDTNHVQYRLVRTLAASHRNVMVVGDDDQSIYRWRGADRRNILDFKKEFEDARIVKLEQNYRSTQRILRAANAVISRAVDREPKSLWTENEEGPAITVVQCSDERREAELVVESVRQLRIGGRSLTEMALFYRLHAQSRVFEEELRRCNVPYRIVGGMRFYDRAEVKDLLAYLRIVENPADDVSVLRVLNTPPRGIGKKSVEGVLDRAAKEAVGVFGAIERAGNEKGAAAKRFAAFHDLIRTAQRRVADGEPLAAIGYALYADSGYKAWLETQDTPEADARRQNVEELLAAIQLAQQDEPELDLTTFLERVTLETEVSEENGAATERLTLMTVHGAKGLEFPVVIVAGLEENMFPFKRASEQRIEPEELEEERRLAYVAVTRAEERLILTWAERRFLFRERQFMLPSRFLDELPREDVQWVGRPSAPPPRPTAPTRRRREYESPAPRVSPGDSYVDRTEGSDFEGETVFVGMSVRHRKFGLGRILQIKPTTPPRVDVEFENRDVRTIQVSYLSPA